MGDGTDPDVGPRGRNGKLPHAAQRLHVAHGASRGIDDAEILSPPTAPEPGLLVIDIAETGSARGLDGIVDDLL